MRWKRGQTSQIEDRRGQSRFGGAGTLPIPIAVGGGGVGILVLLAILALNLLSGGFQTDGGPQGGAGGARATPDRQDDLVQFVGYVVTQNQEFWAQEFDASAETYDETTLVLFTEATQTGCGVGSAQTGPFYCPVDAKMYLDLGFFRELRNRFGAPGDFAQAYVVAHEVGHHVQNLLGTSDQVRRAQQEDPGNANEYSIALELQADCYAGVWAKSAAAEGDIEPGDIDEGLDAAA